MVSETLRAMSSRFGGWAENGGVYLDGPACLILRDTLSAASEDTAAIEGQPVPPAARGAAADLPDGVVSLAEARQARALRAAGGDWGAA